MLKGRSRGSRARLGKGILGGFTRDLGGPSCGEDDPARRAWLVSETGRGSRASALSRQRALMCGPGAQRAKRVRAVRRALQRRGAGRWGQLASETRQRASAWCGREEALTRGAGLPARKGVRVARLERAGASSWAERGRGRREERAGPPGWDWAEGDWAAGLGWGKEKERARRKGRLDWVWVLLWAGFYVEFSIFLFYFFSLSNSTQTI